MAFFCDVRFDSNDCSWRNRIDVRFGQSVRRSLAFVWTSFVNFTKLCVWPVCELFGYDLDIFRALLEVLEILRGYRTLSTISRALNRKVSATLYKIETHRPSRFAESSRQDSPKDIQRLGMKERYGNRHQRVRRFQLNHSMDL